MKLFIVLLCVAGIAADVSATPNTRTRGVVATARGEVAAATFVGARGLPRLGDAERLDANRRCGDVRVAAVGKLDVEFVE